MSDSERVQYQRRSRTLDNADLLLMLPTWVNILDLSPQQRNVLEVYNQHTELLNDLLHKKWELERNKITASVKKLQIDALQRQINALVYERNYFEKEQSILIKELLVIARFRQAEEERKQLEEWRKSRYSSHTSI